MLNCTLQDMRNKMDQIFVLLGQCMAAANSRSSVLAQVSSPIEPAPVLPQASSSASTSVKRVKSRKPHDVQSAGLRASLADRIKSGSELAVLQPVTSQVGQVQPLNVAAVTVSEILSCKQKIHVSIEIQLRPSIPTLHIFAC